MDLKKPVDNQKYSIYCIKNKANGMIYVGQTTQPVERRWYNHKKMVGISTCHIHKAMAEFGKDAFEFSVIDTASSVEELDRLEIEYIETLNCLYPNGYNMKEGGHRGRRVAPLETKRDSLDLIEGVNKADLKRLVDLCRRNGVTKLAMGEFAIEFSPSALFPESQYLKKKADEKAPTDPIITENTYTEEDALFWSSAGIPDHEEAH